MQVNRNNRIKDDSNKSKSYSPKVQILNRLIHYDTYCTYGYNYSNKRIVPNRQISHAQKQQDYTK